MKTDLDFVFWDFASTFEEDPETTLYAFQSLLLDEGACRARVVFLTKLAGGEKKPNDFANEVLIIRRLGVFGAGKEGGLPPHRLAALAGHPEALWQAHQAALALEDCPESPEPAGVGLGTDKKGSVTRQEIGLTHLKTRESCAENVELDEAAGT